MLPNYLATRGSGFGAEVKRRIMLGTYALSAGYYDAYYLKAQKVRTLIKSDFDDAFEQVDALVGTDLPTVAFPLGARLDDPVAMYLSDACTLPANVAGLPGSRSRVASRRVCRWDSSSSASLGTRSNSFDRPRLRGDHRRCRMAPPGTDRTGRARGRQQRRAPRARRRDARGLRLGPYR